MKLIYAFPEPLPLERARGVQVAHMVSELAHLGQAIELVYVPNPPLHPLGYYGLGMPAGLTLTPLSRSLPWPLARSHSNHLFFWRFRRHLRSVRDAVIYVRHLKLAAMLLREPGLRLVYEAHEVFSDTAQTSAQLAQFEMEALVMRSATLVIANSKATARRLKELHGERVVGVLPNGVDWPESLPEKDWAQAAQKIIYAGSFFAWKGVADLVRSAGELPGCRISLLGGDAAQIARERAAAPSSGAQLEFRGQLPHAEVARELQSACIAVLPNRDDPDSRFTSPIKLFEYMAAGCAIVASDLPALRDLLADDDAVWVRPGDPASLAAGILRLTADPALARQMGGRAREKSRGYTWRARAQKLSALLKGLGPAP